METEEDNTKSIQDRKITSKMSPDYGINMDYDYQC